jgi:hypothetical protein
MNDVQFRSAVITYYNKFINISSNIVKDIKEIFCICPATLYNWLDLYKLNGYLIGKQSGRPLNSGKINELIEKYIIKYYTIDRKSKMKNRASAFLKNVDAKNQLNIASALKRRGSQ